MNATQIVASYLILQATGTAAWWALLLLMPSSIGWFMPASWPPAASLAGSVIAALTRLKPFADLRHNMKSNTNPYSVRPTTSDSDTAIHHWKRRLLAFILNLPSFPTAFRVVSLIACISTSIAFLSAAVYTLVLAGHGFSAGKPGCLGAEFGWFITFAMIFIPAWTIAILCNPWSRRWMSLGLLLVIPPLWLVVILIAESG